MDFKLSPYESEFKTRLGITRDAYKVPYNSSATDVCWWTLEAQSQSIPKNDTTFAYSDIESYIAGSIFALQSIVGTILNFLLIIALLRNPKLRKEYITGTIVSILITDLLWCAYILPITSLQFLKGYTINLQQY